MIRRRRWVIEWNGTTYGPLTKKQTRGTYGHAMRFGAPYPTVHELDEHPGYLAGRMKRERLIEWRPLIAGFAAIAILVAVLLIAEVVS